MNGTLIVDDHPLFRQGLKAALEGLKGFEPVIECGSVAEAIRLLSKSEGEKPELAILDLNLPDGSGLDILASFAGLPGSPQFLVLSMNSNRTIALKAITNGATGYASKGISLEVLSLGLSLVKRGQLFLEDEILRDIITRCGNVT